MIVRGTGRTWFLAGDLAHDVPELWRVRPDVARWCEDEGIDVLTAHDEVAADGDSLGRSMNGSDASGADGDRK
jgi:hypothetical protein